ASNEQAAHDCWRHLGETEEPTAVFDLSNLVSLRDKVRDVRCHRGNGAITDGREFTDWDERWFELEAQKRPGGKAELIANAQRIHAIRMRVHEKQLAAQSGK
ncbi:hypothetical protein WHK35_14300, partial [Staphylococcus aureus]|uniref:hypothetical protein n=1 Tax=Staphylococcus aureus TaxID=1280 RepID=UPI0039BE37D3